MCSSLKSRKLIASQTSAVRLTPTHNNLPSCATLRLYSTPADAKATAEEPTTARPARPPHRSRFLSPFLLPVAWLLERWAAWRWLQYELDKAETSMRRAVKMRERVYGADHPDLCNHLAPYATLQRMRGDLALARTLTERVVRICEKYAGEESFLTALALHDLGNVTEDLGKSDDAERLYRRSIELMVRSVLPLPEEEEKRKEIKERNENTEAKTMEVKCDLAVLLEHMGKHVEAMPLHEELFQKAWDVERWDHPFFHSHLHASKHWRVKHFVEARRLAREDREKEARRQETEGMGEKEGSFIRLQTPAVHNDDEWTPEVNPSRTADSGAKGEHEVQALKKEVQEAMNALNREYMKKTQDLTNELAYRKVIDKLSATLGVEHPALCRHLYYMAHVYMENELYPEAESMIKRVLSIQKRERGPYSVPTATAWGVLADLCLRQKNLEDAARLMAQALERKREVLGNGHITVGMLEYEMSGVAQEMAKFNTAISCLKRVRSIFALVPAAKTGDEHAEHPWVGVVRNRTEELKVIKDAAIRQFIKREQGQDASSFLQSPERGGLLGTSHSEDSGVPQAQEQDVMAAIAGYTTSGRVNL